MNIAYFRDAMLYDVEPRDPACSLYDSREVAYHADCIVSDGKRYDLHNARKVSHLRVPRFSPEIPAVLELSYVMKIRCGGVTDPALIPAFVDKTLELMRASRFIWHRRDHLQVIRNYYRLGLFDAGDAYEAAYRARYPDLFSMPGEEKQEAEHQSTKAYFRRKWEKRR